ncbi:hypothetical protein R1sor_022460 [Riccia sorocarpa]|uniref:SWIM-type domain-containing protein n=1 Tax=Riccia sorocarpa TaxID=122646 RepID=A0ABD3GQS9_9MARC
MNTAISQTSELATTPIIINGDIRTKTVKRKLAYNTGIGKNNTHRHDKVAKTQQAIRIMRGRLRFGPEIDSPPNSLERMNINTNQAPDIHLAGPSRTAQVPEIPTRERTPPVQTISSDQESEQIVEEREVHNPFEGEQTVRVAGGTDDSIPDLVHRPLRNAGKYLHSREIRQRGATSFFGSSSDDVQIIDTTARRRPPTRAYPRNRQAANTQGRPTQFGKAVQEAEVDVTKWHLARTSYTGAGPACYAATPGRSAPRALCKTKIRHAGFDRRGVGVVAPSFVGKRKYLSIEREYRFWFCPNGRCYLGRGANVCNNQMPPVADIISVQRGTNMTQEEVDFFTEKDFLLVSSRSNQRTGSFPTGAEIKVLVDAYPEKVDERPLHYRFKTRRGRGCRQKHSPSASCLTQLERARSSSMHVLKSWRMSSGNGYGRLFRVASGDETNQRNYIVNFCSFPSCSCQDFWEREVRLQTYVPCKHLYWV